MHQKTRYIIVFMIMVASFLVVQTHAQQGAEPKPTIRLTSSIQLARLVDLAAQQCGVEIEYTPSALGNKSVTLRQVHILTPEGLWDLCISVLHNNDMTIIRRSERVGLYSVVSLQEAVREVLPRRARDIGTPAPGYVSIIIPLAAIEPSAMVNAIKPIVGSGNKLSVHPAPALSGVIVSGVRERVEFAIEQIEAIDTQQVVPSITLLPVNHRSAMEIAEEVRTLAVSIEKQGGEKLRSELAADSTRQMVQVVGPESELDRIREMITRADQPAAIGTRSLDPRGYPLETVAAFLESVARDDSPRGSGERWRVLQDELTNTLIVTGTPAELDAAEHALERLAAMPPEGKRVIRMIPVRNREATRIREIAGQLLNANILGAQRSTRPSNPANDLIPEMPRPSSDQSTAASDLDLAVDQEMNTIIATGSQMRIAQLESLILELDVRQPQVQLEVIMLSLSESESRDFGVELAGNIDTGDTLIGLGSLFGLSSISPSSTSAQASGAGGSAVVLSPGDFSAVIRAINTVNDGRSTSMPSIVVNNNETATLNSTTTQPFTTTTITDSNITTSRGGSASAGTTITVSPQIAAGDHIVLDYSVSLSSFVGEASSDGVEPPTQQTSLNSIATIPDGYTIALGGIEITSEGDSDTKTPGLADIPLLGALFKSQSDSASRSRFYVFIRPTVMRSPSFEHLKYLSETLAEDADVDDGWPILEPRIIE